MQIVYLVQYQLVGDNFRSEVQSFHLLFKDKDSAEKMAYKLTTDNTLLKQLTYLIGKDNNSIYSIRAWFEELALID